MSGVILQTHVAADAAIRVFGQLRGVMTDTTPVMRAISTALVESTHTRIEKEIDPEGNAWTPLNPLYEAIKRGPGIMRESGMRGGLMGSITGRATHVTSEIGTNKIYAAVHQFGAVIRPVRARKLRFWLSTGLVAADEVHIPARPIFGVSDEDELTIYETLVDALDRARGLGR